MRSSFFFCHKKNAYLYGRVKSNEKKKKKMLVEIIIRDKKKTIYSLHSFSLLFSFDVMAFLYKIFRCSSESSSLVIDG